MCAGEAFIEHFLNGQRALTTVAIENFYVLNGDVIPVYICINTQGINTLTTVDLRSRISVTSYIDNIITSIA